MLTIKQITDNTDAVIRGLEKKHFKNAQETIGQVLETNDKRRNTQTILDKNLSEVNSLSKSIGLLMKVRNFLWQIPWLMRQRTMRHIQSLCFRCWQEQSSEVCSG